MSTILYKKAKTGKISTWEVWLETDKNGVPVIMRKSGYQDGKKTLKKRFVRKGTNKGKVNEKTPYENAEFIMENMVKSKLEENMVRSIDDVSLPPKYIYPALAKPYNDKKLIFPCYVQPKFNGARAFRMTHLKDPRIISRERNEFTCVDHIRKAIDEINAPEYFSPDGEIYLHGLDLQEIISLLKKKYKRGEKEDSVYGTEDLEYHVYDLAIPGKTFEERHNIIDGIIPDNHPILKKVETVLVKSIEEIKSLHDAWVNQGYEGIIIRYKKGHYAFNDRDYTMMKYKEFIDEEFPIVGYDCEEYTDPNTNEFFKLVLWRCETEDGKTFSARPKGSFASRVLLYKIADEQIGKLLTVRYQERTPDNIPLFPVGIVIRDYE